MGSGAQSLFRHFILPEPSFQVYIHIRIHTYICIYIYTLFLIPLVCLNLRWRFLVDLGLCLWRCMLLTGCDCLSMLPSESCQLLGYSRPAYPYSLNDHEKGLWSIYLSRIRGRVWRMAQSLWSILSSRTFRFTRCCSVLLGGL